MRTETVICDRCGEEAGPLDRVAIQVDSDRPEEFGRITPSAWLGDLCWTCWDIEYRGFLAHRAGMRDSPDR
ncbi:MAG: hypothetical protein KF809_17455 [Chloroflexi bacterium]|nr:hypothetical protein [Chloroflexota bacterium]